MAQAVDTPEAVQAALTATQFVQILLSPEDITDVRVEEFQPSSDGTSWLVTVGFLRPEVIQPLKYLEGVKTRFRDYKVVTIDKSNGKAISMRNREGE